jgi:hypothetical protein
VSKSYDRFTPAYHHARKDQTRAIGFWNDEEEDEAARKVEEKMPDPVLDVKIVKYSPSHLSSISPVHQHPPRKASFSK